MRLIAPLLIVATAVTLLLVTSTTDAASSLPSSSVHPPLSKVTLLPADDDYMSDYVNVEYHTPSGGFQPGASRSFQISTGGTQYNITVSRTQLTPIISSQYAQNASGSSEFTYCYNAAFLPLGYSRALLARCQQLLNQSDPYSVGPSYMVLTEETEPGMWTPLTYADVVFKPTEPYETYGTEDPRIQYENETGVYSMFYSAVQTLPSGAPMSRLSLATTTDPSDINAWVKHGPIIANNITGGSGGGANGTNLSDYQWSKSGALLRAPEGETSLLIFGDSSIVNGLQTAAPSSDFLTYQYNSTIFLPTRSDMFDSALVEAGPPPLVLSNGVRFFLYNSARTGYPSVKPNWDTQYNIGFLLLDPVDPYTILYRSSIPLFSPELEWEMGVSPYLGLTPNVVFVEGAQKVEGEEVDTIDFWYGAADSCVGGARIVINIQ